MARDLSQLRRSLGRLAAQKARSTSAFNLCYDSSVGGEEACVAGTGLFFSEGIGRKQPIPR